MTAPFAFIHGPVPIRSFALTAGCPAAAAALRYARQVRLPAPAAAASVWQCLSAPLRPPKLAPLPEPTLVTKNVIGFGCCADSPNDATSRNTTMPSTADIALTIDTP